MDNGEKAANDLERGVWGWAAALMPLIDAMVTAILGTLRRMVLALFGGVPAEEAKAEKDVAAMAIAGDGRQHDGGGRQPRWQDRLVRESLRRIAEGLPLRPRQLDQLPASVREWLRALGPEDAAALRHLSTDALRLDFTTWRLGGEVLDDLREDARRKDKGDDFDPGAPAIRP
jgi:hypothetical protein